MPNYNKVILMGHLGADPELRYTQNGSPVSSFRLAINRKWKGKDNSQHEETTWTNVTVWGPQAESVAKYLNKGSPVMIDGRLNYRTWQDKEGNNRSSLEVTAESVTFLARGDKEEQKEIPQGPGPEIPF
jgi:single-strand DNA-binding protein